MERDETSYSRIYSPAELCLHRKENPESGSDQPFGNVMIQKRLAFCEVSFPNPDWASGVYAGGHSPIYFELETGLLYSPSILANELMVGYESTISL
jgi:hypothetical protein